MSHLIDNLDCAIKAWRREQSPHNASALATASQDTLRVNLLEAARNLVSALEAPKNTIVEIAKSPAGHAALRTAFRLKIFDCWSSDETKTSTDLATQTGAEELLIVRIMRALVGIRFFEEKAENTYGHSKLSRELIDSTFRTMVVGMTSTAGLTMAKLPEYLASIDFRCPRDPDNALFQYALSTNLNMFQWLETQPEQLAIFSAYNAASTERRGPVLHALISALLPASKTATSSQRAQVEEDQVLLVDVGAGRGQVLAGLRKERPDLIGRMVAQDLPEVIAGREVADGVENMAFNFFQPQPVQGASVYFFSHIFHDWADVTCRQILTNTIPALTVNYSRIVIVDQILPNTGAPAISSLMDVSMMTFGGMERTERQWREMLEGVGLSVVSLTLPNARIPGSDGTIVAVLMH